MNLFSGYIGQVPSSAHAFHNCDTNITVICKHDGQTMIYEYDFKQVIITGAVIVLCSVKHSFCVEDFYAPFIELFIRIYS